MFAAIVNQFVGLLRKNLLVLTHLAGSDDRKSRIQFQKDSDRILLLQREVARLRGILWSINVLLQHGCETGDFGLDLLLVRELDLRHLMRVYGVLDIVVDCPVEEDPRVPKRY